MLRRIRCSGFKSFDNFELDIQPGLNILVGSNGSGKTNLIQLLEFLSNLRHQQLIEAIAELGGAGSVFRRTDESFINSEIVIGISGSGQAYNYKLQCHVPITYSYKANIKLFFEESTAAFSAQSLEIEGDTQESSKVRITCQAAENQKHASVSIIRLDEGLLSTPPSVKGIQAKQQLQDIISDLGRDRSLIEICRRYFVGSDLINQDLLGGKAFNINPSKVRSPEDIATPPRIRSDGEGLGATLFALKGKMRTSRHQPDLFSVMGKDGMDREKIFARIVAYTRLVNKNIQNIEVTQEFFDTKIRISVQLDTSVGPLGIPFSLVSDGTAKWIALVAAIITSRGTFALEEPENFLHPAMQAEIMRLLRLQYENSGDSFALLTTHSQTILDNAFASELIICEMIQGRTTAKRVSNSEDIRAEIAMTGFGLGHYYISGAVEG